MKSCFFLYVVIWQRPAVFELFHYSHGDFSPCWTESWFSSSLVKLSRENDNRAVSEGKSYPIITDLDFLPADYPIFIIITREVQLTLVPIDSFPNHGRKWSSKGVPEHYKLSRFVIRNKTSTCVFVTQTVLSRTRARAGCFSRQTIYLRICQIPCLSDEGVDCTLRFHQSWLGFSTAPPFSRWRAILYYHSVRRWSHCGLSNPNRYYPRSGISTGPLYLFPNTGGRLGSKEVPASSGVALS